MGVGGYWTPQAEYLRRVCGDYAAWWCQTLISCVRWLVSGSLLANGCGVDDGWPNNSGTMGDAQVLADPTSVLAKMRCYSWIMSRLCGQLSLAFSLYTDNCESVDTVWYQCFLLVLTVQLRARVQGNIRCS